MSLTAVSSITNIDPTYPFNYMVNIYNDYFENVT